MTKTIENKVIFRLSKSVIGNVEKRAVNRILSNGFLGTGPETEAFESEISKYLGIGNATGLGMAPFLIKHPVLIHNWVLARETALSRVIALESQSPETLTLFSKYLQRAIQHIAEWNVEDKLQTARILKTREDLKLLSNWFADEENLKQTFLWQRILHFAEINFSQIGRAHV